MRVIYAKMFHLQPSARLWKQRLIPEAEEYAVATDARLMQLLRENRRQVAEAKAARKEGKEGEGGGGHKQLRDPKASIQERGFVQWFLDAMMLRAEVDAEFRKKPLPTVRPRWL